MKAPRRVVTNTDALGRAVFISDGPAPRSHAYTSLAPMRTTIVWATDAAARPDGTDPTVQLTRDIPSFGETRLVFVTFPPDAVFARPDLDPAAVEADNHAATPMLAELFEPENPGMHRSPTIDYAIVLDGEIVLELDDGQQTRLRRGDVVVQNATRHRWSNPTDQPCTIAYTWIGIGSDVSTAQDR